MAQHSGNLSGKVCINCSCPLEREDDSVTAVSKPNKQIGAHGQSNEPWQAKVCVSSRSNMERERYGATDRPTLCNRKRNEGMVVWYSGSTETR